MNIPNLLHTLNLGPGKPEGEQLLILCPTCEAEKLSINTSSGKWKCFHGCAKGNPWSLVELFRPGIAKAEVMKILQDTDCADGLDTKTPKVTAKQQANQEAEERHGAQVAKYRVYEKGLCTATDADLDRWCRMKGFDREILKRFKPRLEVMKPHIALPVINPGRLDEGEVGAIIAHLDGEQITVGKDKITDEWIKKKYKAAGTGGLYAAEWLMAQDQTEPLIYTEGSGDALAAMSLGFLATASNLGAGFWRPGFEAMFKGRIVYLVNDRDTAGVNASLKLAGKLNGVAAEVRIVDLPYPLTPSNGKDLKDFIQDDGATHDQLQALCHLSPIFDPKQAAVQATDDPGPGPESTDGLVKLPDAEGDTIAAAFEADSPYKHFWNEKDSWSMYKDNMHQQISVHAISTFLARFMARCIHKKGKEYVRVSMSDSNQKSVLGNLKKLEGVYLNPRQSSPCSLDGKLDVDWAIPMVNGILDFKVWPPVLHPKSREFYCLSSLPYAWEPDAHSDVWDRFLATITNSDQDLMDLLQLWSGYCLTREKGIQVFLIIFGKPGTGKSMFAQVLGHMLGSFNVSHVELADFKNKNSLYMTYQKLVNMSDEADETLEKGIESKLKTYVGGGVVSFKSLYKDEFEAMPTAKIMITCDKMPHFRGDLDNGTWRRAMICPFKHVVTQEERVKDIDLVLSKQGHLPAVLNWALHGAKRIQKMGCFPVSAKCEATKLELQENCIPEITFFRDNFGPLYANNNDILKLSAIPQKFMKEIYINYIEEQEGRHAKATRNFMETARRIFVHPDDEYGPAGETCIGSMTFRFSGNPVKCWTGIKVIPESEYYEKYQQCMMSV